ncbi:MAG: NB-ARC domain-containing protein, partial [Pseudonocardia sp.]
MGVEPLEDEGAKGGRDLVFVGYSHDDAAWAQRIGVLLTPLLRWQRLRLWVDTDLRAGDAWRSEIMAGIVRSRAALLLVSADFLASDFIIDIELPALVEQGVRLAPVLVGDCLWHHEPALAEVQWLHDPGRDGALNLVGRRGRRDQRLREICDRLLQVIPPGDEPVTTEPEQTVAVPAGVVMREIPLEAVGGAVFGVPVLPPGYVVREELAGLIEAVVAVSAGGAVGVIGDVAAVGLHGQGGIGKSVLAAALGRDEEIGCRFPDGVYWVTVGERPDVLALQLELLARLGASGMAPRTVADATEALTEVLAGRRVLLVVDDVWSAAVARVFRVTGPRGRVVYTSRDPAVITAAGARPHRVDVLSPAAARAVAAAVLAVTPEDLPGIAEQAFAEVGWVALAVALLAAAVRGGRSWAQVAADLDREGAVFGAHPYANTFKAMQIAVDALPDALAEALLSLAVFPPDTQIPITTVSRYWAHTRTVDHADTVADLDRLATAGVLARDGEVIELLSRPGARFRCFHRSVSPGRSPNPSCRSLGNGLSTVSAVRRGSGGVMGWGSCCP